jgi:hypothetical protein
MRVQKTIFTWAFVVAYSFSSAVLASPARTTIQSSHGLSVTTLSSGLAGASLLSETNSETPIGESGRPFTGGILWALPLGTTNAQVSVRSAQWRDALPGEFPDSVIAAVLADPESLVTASPVMTMRAMSFTTLAVNAVQPKEDGPGLRVCERCEFDVHYSGGGQIPDTRKLSRSFYELAHGVAANLDEVVPEPELRPESYLIITPPAYVGNTLNTFVNWKKARGHTVRVATTTETGTTNQQIKNYIQNAYDTWDEPPVFIMLIGDVDGTNPLPAWQEPGFFHPWDISDHRYTLLDGTDWLPDAFIGRLSVSSTAQLQTVINKCVNYESQPFEPTGAWRTRMLITGVRASASFYPTYNSSWQTLQWVGRQCLAHGYSEIDSVPAPPGTTSQITAAINAGVSFAGYRGFGAPDMWDFPQFMVSDVNSLTNGQRLPVVTSIVCGGGAFDSQSPCLGEAFLRAGTPANPAGAIGFIGPSELDTKTRWNNTNISGIYEGILFENIQTLAAAMLRGKLELMREFPNNISNNTPDSDRSVSFYFFCYNLLGDPGLTFFVGPVRDLSASVPDSATQGLPTLSFPVTENGAPLADVWGTIRQGDSVYSRAASDSTGHMILALPGSLTGVVVVTLTKPRHEPQQDTVHIVSRASGVAAQSFRIADDGTHTSIGNGDGIPDAGERVAMGVTLRNFGTSPFAGGILSIVSNTNALSIVSGQVAVPALAVGAETDTLFLTADVASLCGDGQNALITWSITPGSMSWQTSLDIHAPRLSAVSVRTDGADANPNPNSTSWIALGISNLGRAIMPAGIVTLHSTDSRLTLLDSVAAYPAIAPGATVQPADQGFHAALGSFYPGDWAQVELTDNDGSASSPFDFPLPIGNLQGSDPTHPDGYGYRAFQNTDTAYAESPAYEWVEIDPTRGGLGTLCNIPDTGSGHDTTAVISLPFNFTFYGHTYNHIGICSNGFISFGQSIESYFRNYSLPAIASPDQMVCAFWDDLFVPSDGHICTYYDSEDGRFIIEWSRLRNATNNSMEETFEILLYDTGCWNTRTGDGDILVQYLTFNNVDTWDNYATVGIQDHVQGYALQVTYANQLSPGVSAIQSGQSILFTTGRPQGTPWFGYAGNVVDDDNQGGSHGNGDGVVQNGETIQLSIRLCNSGTAIAPAQSAVLYSTDPYAVRLDSTLIVPSVAPGDTVVSTSVRVHLLPSSPDGHICDFTLRLADGSSPCVVLPSLRVSGPVLSGIAPLMDDDSIPPSHGNNDHVLNPDETVEWSPGAANIGGNIALGVHAVLRYTGNQITLLDSLAYIGTVGPDSQTMAADPFVIHVFQLATDGTPLLIQIVLRDSFGTVWTYSENYLIHAPQLATSGARISDPSPGGNNNGHLNLGETAELYPRVANIGTGGAANVTLSLRSRDSLVTLSDSIIVFGTVAGDSVLESSTPLHIFVSGNGVEPRTVSFDATITQSTSVQFTNQLVLMIGDVPLYDDVEDQANGWSMWGTPNLWHIESYQYHSPAHAFYCGDDQTGIYPPRASAELLSPPFVFSGTGTLVFSTWYLTADASDVCHVHFQTGANYALLTDITGNSQGWRERRISLAGIAPSDSARVRFWFVSNGSGQGEGIYVDDIIVLDQDLPVTDEPAAAKPARFELMQNFPNPFNDQTTIRYSVPRPSSVRLSLFDLQGRRVATLVNGTRDAGTYRLSWKPISLASGIYFVRLDAANVHLTTKIAYLK